MAIDGIIFDFNGTLFKDGEYHVLAWQIISEQLTGKKMTRQEIEEKTHGACNEVTIDRLSNGTLSREENLLWSRKKEAMYREMVKEDAENANLVEGCEALFTWLSEKKIPFTIASASIWENIEFFFAFFKLDRWFDINQVIYDDGSYPDKVPMFLDAAQLLKTEPKKTLIFEDSDSGYRSAVNAGFTHIMMIIDDLSRQEIYRQKEAVIACGKDFTELKKKIEELL